MVPDQLQAAGKAEDVHTSNGGVLWTSETCTVIVFFLWLKNVFHIFIQLFNHLLVHVGIQQASLRTQCVLGVQGTLLALEEDKINKT